MPSSCRVVESALRLSLRHTKNVLDCVICTCCTKDLAQSLSIAAFSRFVSDMIMYYQVPKNTQLFCCRYLQYCSEMLVVVTTDGHNSDTGHKYLHAVNTGCIYNGGCGLQSVAAIMKIYKAGTALSL